MRMQPPPMQHMEPIPRETLLSEDQWISSIIDHWSAAQRRSWLSLDRTFRGWVAHLVWTTKNAGRPSHERSVDADTKRALFQVPAGCPVESYIAPAQSVDDSMAYFRDALPEIDWSGWSGIEPKFRSIAEWELSALHARALQLAAQRSWWERNERSVQACLDSPQPLNSRYEQIDRREKLEREALDRERIPEPVRQAARRQISDAAAVDRYLAAWDVIHP
jgi:hypothetical protein